VRDRVDQCRDGGNIGWHRELWRSHSVFLERVLELDADACS
jgi:hypothetical protein